MEHKNIFRFKTVAGMSNEANSKNSFRKLNDTEEEITKRLQNLKESNNDSRKQNTDEVILKRLKDIKGNQPTTSDAELQLRLANLKGLPAVEASDKVY